METYDLLVIGSGPAGQRAAIQAAKFGKKVALVEKMEVVGGVAINTGTIPSKTMREAVLHLSGFYWQSIYGVNYRVKEQITMADLSFRAQHVIKTEIDVTRAQLSRNGIEVLNGVASFVDPNRIRVVSSRGQSEYQTKDVVIATGTKPAISPLVPFNNRNIINSDQVLQMPEIPKTLIVVGGGVIGVEYTCMFATLGVRVALIEKRPRLLEFADAEMVEALSYHLRDRRVTMRLNEEVESVEELPDKTVVANLKSKKKVNGDALLYAVGRQGNVDELNLAAAGLEADSRGRIKVDENYRTAQPHIFAVGDVIGFPSLGSVSMEQGRIAAANACGMKIHSTSIRRRDSSLLHRNRTQAGESDHVAHRENMRLRRPVIFIHFDSSARIRFQTSGRQIQFVHVALPPHRIKQRVAIHFFLALQIRDDRLVGQLFDAFDFFIQTHRHAPVAQMVRKRFHHLRVRKFEQPRPLFNQRYAHAQRREHARIFHADYAAAHHNQRLRNLRHLQHLVAVDNVAVVEGHERRNRRLGTGRDYNVLCLVFRLSARAHHANFVRVDKTRHAVQHFNAVARKLRSRHIDFGLDHVLRAER